MGNYAPIYVSELAGRLMMLGLHRHARQVEQHGSNEGIQGLGYLNATAAPWSTYHHALFSCMIWKDHEVPGSSMEFGHIHRYLMDEHEGEEHDEVLMGRYREETGMNPVAPGESAVLYTVDDLYSWLERNGREKHCRELERVLVAGRFGSGVLPGSGYTLLSGVLSECMAQLQEVDDAETWGLILGQLRGIERRDGSE